MARKAHHIIPSLLLSRVAVFAQERIGIVAERPARGIDASGVHRAKPDFGPCHCAKVRGIALVVEPRAAVVYHLSHPVLLGRCAPFAERQAFFLGKAAPHIVRKPRV